VLCLCWQTLWHHCGYTLPLLATLWHSSGCTLPLLAALWHSCGCTLPLLAPMWLLVATAAASGHAVCRCERGVVDISARGFAFHPNIDTVGCANTPTHSRPSISTAAFRCFSTATVLNSPPLPRTHCPQVPASFTGQRARHLYVGGARANRTRTTKSFCVQNDSLISSDAATLNWANPGE
jgi:hypothetical protein